MVFYMILLIIYEFYFYHHFNVKILDFLPISC